MVSLSQFIASDGVSINWRRLGTVLVGAGIFAYFQGIVRTLLALADIPIALLSRYTALLGRLIGTVVGTWGVVIDRTVSEATAYLETTGIGGYLLALGLVLVTLWGLEEVISRVR